MIGARGACILATLLALLLAAGASPAADSPGVVPGQIAVRFRASTQGVTLREWTSPAGGRYRLEPLIAAPAPARTPRRPGARVDPVDDCRRFVRLFLPPGRDPVTAAREAATDPAVEIATPIHLLPCLGTTAVTVDPEVTNQWQHEAIDSPAAWDRANGTGVIIAIIDTGIDLDHADLAPNLWINPAEASGISGLDDDANGYIDDVHGYDFTDVPEIIGAGDYRDRDADPSDDVGHGTWVAGAAAAAGNNGIGGAGVAWNSRIMPLRAGFQPGVGFSLGFLAEDDAAAAIVYAVDNGADILNLSFGDVVRSPILEEAVRYAVDRGVLVVAASGNSGDNIPFQPASLAGVLAVGASSRDGTRAGFSSWGPSVQLLAPGSGILTTELGGGVASKSGTSLATPVAAGALAILKEVHPEWSAARLIQALYESSAAPTPPESSARGGRLLRLDRSLDAAGDAEIRLELDEGMAVDDTLVVRGSVFGSGVRGWRVMARPTGPDGSTTGGAWRTLRSEARRAALDEELARLSVADQPETAWVVRVEALGLDRVLAFRERRIRIDHTPPVITGLVAFPVLAIDPVTGEAGYGVRVVAEADEFVFGRLSLSPAGEVPPPFPGNESPYFERTLSSRKPILGVDQPLRPGPWELDVSFRNDAGLISHHALTLMIPASVVDRPVTGGAPDAATYLPVLIDLDGDGQVELVGESRERSGAFYGDLRAWSYAGDAAPTLFEEAWRSEHRGIPRDVGDFDGDGRPDLLVLALQKAQVYTARMPGGFPTFRLFEVTNGWAALFIRAASGTGLDVVTSFDNEIRIFRRGESGPVLDQALINPTNGLNSISPAIVRLSPGLPGGPGLATIDSDGDLLLAWREPDGHFEWGQTIALGARFTGDLAAVDLDGDGRSELAVIEAIGEVPSPTVALRDGFYRLHVYRPDVQGMYRPWQQLGFTGQFPGNPVQLQGGIPISEPALDGGSASTQRGNLAAPEWLWVTINGRAWRIRQAPGEERLVVDSRVDGVGDGPLAWGVVASGPAVRDLTVLPTAAGQAPVDGDLISASAIGTGFQPGGDPSGIISLVARHLGTAPGGDRIRLDWSGGAVGRIIRDPLDTAPPSVEWLLPPGAMSFTDSTATRGLSYRYSLVPEGGADRASLEVIVEPANPVTGSVWDGRRLIVEWTWPVRARESARLRLERSGETESGGPPGPEAIASSLLDREGRRLIVELASGVSPGTTYRLVLTGFVSASGLLLAGPDAAIEFVPERPTAPLRLVRVRALDATTLLVTLAPRAPTDPDPADFEIPGGPAIVAAAREDDVTIRLTLVEPPRAADLELRLKPTARGPGGEVIRLGEGDSVPFRLKPVAYPNPARGGATVTFDWVPVGSRVTVHDLAGREVWSGVESTGGSIHWNLVGTDGRVVAPGVYLFRLDSTPDVLGKLSILR